jgi:hypothetical protein
MKTEVEVTTTDIQTFKTAINTAYYKSLTEDMQKAYSSLSQTPRNSPLTKFLEDALTKVDGYLEEANTTEETTEEETEEANGV